MACLLAAGLRMAGAGAMHSVAAATGSGWLAGNIVPLSFVGALLDASVWSVLGFGNTTLFGWVAPYAPILDSSIDPPMWSLHVEFWGSMLVLPVVAARSWGALTYRLVLVGAAVACGPFPITLFLLGHLCAPLARMEKSMPRLGLLCIAAGLLLSTVTYIPGQYRIVDLIGQFALLRPHYFFKLPPMIAAMLLFLVVLVTPAARTALATKPVLWLGRQSFSIYLVHVPVLFSAGVAAYLVGGILLAGPVALGGTLVLAAGFERLVDRPAVAWSRAVGRSARALALEPTVLPP
jgi:peptidoglycan/LPS O-acetylase OafA/YrhL